MLSVALTGGIGSGKTAVTKLFQQLASNADFQGSLKIIDADVIARDLLAGSLKQASINAALRDVHQLFGSDIFDSDGYLDRYKLRSLIFSSKNKKAQLEALLHPLVYDEIFSQLTSIHSGIVIIAIPLFFETRAETRAEIKADNKFDRILVIDVPVEIQIERSSKRDKCSEKLVKEIISSQVERRVRLNQADDIIDNSGAFSELQLKVAALLQKYQSLANKSS